LKVFISISKKETEKCKNEARIDTIFSTKQEQLIATKCSAKIQTKSEPLFLFQEPTGEPKY
jgi:hypothetical protein